jgi:triacylglycerol lipase
MDDSILTNLICDRQNITMELDYSWESLFKPGDATDYFNWLNPTPLQAGVNNFSLSNAWWLAEISRLTYHPDFYLKKDINCGSFDYELLGFIDNQITSTQVAILKVNYNMPCLVIAFRGTDEIENWNTNVHAYQSSFNDIGKVHSGFKKAYLSIKKELHEYLKNNTLPVFITGHSLGAALAILATSEVYPDEHFDSCYTFGSPRVGNLEFFDSVKCQQIYRVINNCDVVTTVPIDFTAIKYKHIGTPYLINDSGDLIDKLNEDEIYSYQKSKLSGLKDYAISKIFNNGSKSIKDDLPAFLADHSPINYVLALQKLTNI